MEWLILDKWKRNVYIFSCGNEVIELKITQKHITHTHTLRTFISAYSWANVCELLSYV